MSIKPYLTFLVAIALLVTPALADDKPASGATLSVGKNLTYVRGTARAKECILEFPYRHAKSGNRQYWASVVHHKGGSRLICKADEAQGEKDESGQLATQDFPADHHFQRTLDIIKHDAFVNKKTELLKEKKLKEEDWAVLSGGSAVHKVFYKNSKGQWFCFLGVKDPNSGKLSGPIIASFKRTRRGPEFATMSAGGSWTPFQPLNVQTNATALKVFAYMEKNLGY